MGGNTGSLRGIIDWALGLPGGTGASEVTPLASGLLPFGDGWADALTVRPRVILLDIYGTVLLSGSGEVGSDLRAPARGAVGGGASGDTGREQVGRRFIDTFCELSGTGDGEVLEKIMQHYREEIRLEHARKRDAGFAHPEVDIIEIWVRVIGGYARAAGAGARETERGAAAELALLFELWNNPVQVAGGVADLLAYCRQAGIGLGVISNAQFYTPLILEAALGRGLAGLGFDERLLWWSYVGRRAKPDVWMFEQAIGAIAGQVGPGEILYVGNDQRNDVTCANKSGMQSCLYYGDERSVRLFPDAGAARDNPPTIGVGGFAELQTRLENL